MCLTVQIVLCGKTKIYPNIDCIESFSCPNYRKSHERFHQLSVPLLYACIWEKAEQLNQCAFSEMEVLFPSFLATFIIPKELITFFENRTETKFSSQTISKVTICGRIILYWTFHSNEADSVNFTLHCINIHNSG
jgi:hypothetical protein